MFRVQHARGTSQAQTTGGRRISGTAGAGRAVRYLPGAPGSQARPGSALISRYVTRPLLSPPTNIGVYVVGLRAEVTPAPQLRHLGLQSDAGMLSPPDDRQLLSLAACGQLTTLIDEVPIGIGLTVQGYAHLGLVPPGWRAGAADVDQAHGSHAGQVMDQRLDQLGRHRTSWT